MVAEAQPQLLALVGAGIARSLSPALHEGEAHRHGMRCLYRLLDIGPVDHAADARLEDVLRSASRLGFSGLNITHPYKQLAIPHMNRLAPSARRIGAVNTVVFTETGAVGHNTDVHGFGAALARGLPGAAMGEVVQLGAGGAGSAVAYALLDLGAQRLWLTDPNLERARGLAKNLNEAAGADRAQTVTAQEADARTAGADGLVNASPVGTEHDLRLPLPKSSLHPQLWVADVNYHPLWTPLLTTAHAMGCRVLHGGGMLVHQAAESFRLFTGCEPHTPRMLGDFADLTAEVGAHS
ncbi:shikimate dehydrogenase [Streptomyces sp. NPDC102360]|uniref:shikimate dehydrogenase n=1 Tax=Streptomyces sp. NPDC102360 TaxID=3366160 RepID=UPI00381A744F